MELKILREGHLLSQHWFLLLSYDSVIVHLLCIQIYLRRRNSSRGPFIPFVILLKLALFSFPLLYVIWIFTLCIPSSIFIILLFSILLFYSAFTVLQISLNSLIYVYKCKHLYIYAYRINLRIKCKFNNFSHIIALKCTSGISF